MPVVPTYDNLRTSVQQAPTPGVSGPGAGAIAGQQTQQLGRSMMDAGSAMSRLLLDAQNEANDVRVTDAMNQAVQLRTDAQLEAIQLKGRNALERPGGKSLPEELSGALQEKLDSLRNGLGNDAQKQAFATRAAQLVTQFRGAVGEHVVREFHAHADEVDQSTISVAQNQAALLWGDKAMQEQSRGAIAAAVSKIAKRKGWDKDQVERATTEAMSPLHLGVMKGMLSGGMAAEAATYLSENSATMTIQTRAQAQEMTKIGAAREKAQTALDDMAARGLDPAAMLAEARQKFKGEERDELERRIEHRTTVNAALAAKQVKALSDQAWTEAQAKGRIEPATLAALRGVNAGQEIGQIESFLDARRRRAMADAEGNFKPDLATYLKLSEMARDPETMAEFSALDLMKFKPYLSDSEIKHFDALKTAIAKGDLRAMEGQRVIRTTLASIKFDVMKAGVDLTPKESDKAGVERAQRFMHALTVALDEAQAAAKAQGKVLTPEEAKRVGMSLVSRGIRQGSGIFGFGQTRKFGFEIATDPKIDKGANFVAARYADIPAAAREALLADLESKGVKFQRSIYGNRDRQVDDDAQAAIERAYTKGLQTGRFQR